MARWRGLERPIPLGLLALALTALAWPGDLRARIGVDEGWEAALHQAGPAGLRFGEDLVFTYGPLGFLSVPGPIFGPSSLLAIAASGLVYLAVSAAVLRLAAGFLAWPVAIAVAYAVVRTFEFLPPFEALQALVVVWSIGAIRGASGRADPGSARRARDDLVLAAAAGAVAGLLLLGKLNVAAFSGAILFVTTIAVTRPAWRGAAVFAAAGAAAALLAWLATGQGLDDIPAYVTGSIEIVRGYSDAMAYPTPRSLLWLYPAFAVVALVAGYHLLPILRALGRRERLALLAVCALIGFAEWKTAFTRNYPFYAVATAAIVLVAIVGPHPSGAAAGRERPGSADAVARPRPPRGLGPALATLVAIVLVFLPTARVDPIDHLDPRESARSAFLAGLAWLPGRQAAAAERTRALLREDLALGDAILAELAGRTTHVDGWQTIVVAAYPEIRWSPLPVFQSYSVYTAELDELNASRLRAGDAPQRILRERVDDRDGAWHAIDRRFPWWEAPATTLETLCRYREAAATQRWQVLARTDGACGEPEVLATVTAAGGEAVAVPPEPRPDRAVIVRVEGLSDDTGERLRTTLWRGTIWRVELGGIGIRRLVPGTVGQGLLVAVPRSVPSHPRFAFGPPIPSVAISSGSPERDAGLRLTYTFESVPLPPDVLVG